MNEEIQVAAGLTRTQKGLIIGGATLATAGVAYGVYRLIKFLKARKASKEEVHE